MATIVTDDIRIGTSPAVRVNFTTAFDNVAADPTSVTFIYQAPDGTQQTYTTPDATIVNDAVGQYTWTAPNATDQVGDYIVYVAGVGNGVTAAEQVKITVHGTDVTLP